MVYSYLFCLIYPLTKSKIWFYPQQRLVIPNFRVKPVRIIVSMWDETLIKCSYKQAWILSRSGLLKLLKFEKQFHTNRHITESRGRTLGKSNVQPTILIFLVLINDNNFNQPVTQWYCTSVLVFYAQYLTFWEQWLKVILSRHLWESIDIAVSFYGFWGEPCLTQISILKRYNNFKCALWQRRKRFAQSTPKFRKVTVARFEFAVKYWLTLKINQFIYKNQFEKTSLWPDKNHPFSYVFQSYFQVFWKDLSCQSISMKNTRSRNDVQCTFVH